MFYLTKSKIVRLNKATVLEHGGNYQPPHNFLHESTINFR